MSDPFPADALAGYETKTDDPCFCSCNVVFTVEKKIYQGDCGRKTI